MTVGSEEHQEWEAARDLRWKSSRTVGNTLLRGKGACLILKTDFTVVPTTRTRLKDLQAAVGGYIEFVRCPMFPQYVMVVNEEGLLHGLPGNTLASALALGHIVGDVVLMPERMAR